MSPLNCIEFIFHFLLPPACREHVLGDLRQKYKSTRRYLVEGVSVLGPVILSRIRRTTDFQLSLMEIFAVYLSFSAAAWWLGRITFLYDQAGFARLVIPTITTATALLLCNAYANLEKKSPVLRPVLQSLGSLALAFFGQTVLFDTDPTLAVPFEIMLYGSATSLVLLSTLRMLFMPAHPNRLTHESSLMARSVPVVAFAAALLIGALLISTIWHRF